MDKFERALRTLAVMDFLLRLELLELELLELDDESELSEEEALEPIAGPSESMSDFSEASDIVFFCL